MAGPATRVPFLDLLRQSRLVTDAQLDAHLPDAASRTDGRRAAEALIAAGVLTPYQVRKLNAGKVRGFFLGAYKLLAPLGRGGMGAVFLAEHTALGRKVALKLLPPQKAKDTLAFERFRREARAAAALDHPNIVRLHDLGREAGVNFLVMEYVDGTTLHALLKAAGPLPYPVAVRYALDAAAGLRHAHERGFIHRDVKPANLILPRGGGGVKLLDMGLARSVADPSHELTARLAKGDIAGTADYLSPEQAMDLPLDERTDVYSLGVTLYALLTGGPPFAGDTADKLVKHQLSEPPSVALKAGGRVPQSLSDVVARMMAKDPDRRVRSAAEVITALRPWAAAEPRSETHTPAPPDLSAPTKRSTGRTMPIRRTDRKKAATAVRPRRWPLFAAVGAVALLLAVGVLPFAAGKPTASVRPPDPSAVAPTGKVLYALDLSGQKPFRDRGRVSPDGGWLSVEKTGDGALPAWWTGVPWAGEDEAEYFAEDAGGRPVIGFRDVRGTSAMLFSPPVELPDGRVRVTVEYRTDAARDGWLFVKFQQVHPEAAEAWATASLPPTDGGWRRETFDLLRRGATGGMIEFHTQGEVRAVWLRAVEVTTAP